jgi:G3E family GTPase
VVDNFRLDGVVTTVDAMHAGRQLGGHAEAFKQMALADRLVMTKTDLCSEEAATAAVHAVRQVNARAPLLKPVEVTAAAFFSSGDIHLSSLPHAPVDTERHVHGQRVESITLAHPDALAWQPFNRWLTALRVRHGEQLLRVKGVVALEGERWPVAIHGVHHLFHPPLSLPHLTGWTGATLVVIVHAGIRPDVEASWQEFLRQQTKEAAKA